MGKVFTPEELGQGFIPKDGAHAEAAQYIVDQLLYPRDLLGESTLGQAGNGIDSGLVYGSATHDTANLRSDLDVLLIYEPHTTALRTIKNVFDVTRRSFKVPVEANILTVDDALQGTHRLDSLFMRYLATAQENEGFSRGWPICLLERGMSDDRSPEDVVRKYIGGKAAGFSKELVADELDTHRLQRAFELPKNLGRKVLSMASEDFRVEEHSGKDILEGLIDFIATQTPTPDKKIAEICRDLHFLTDRDEEYTGFLEDVIDCVHPIITYVEWLKGPEPTEAIESALTLCQNMGQVMRWYAEGRAS